MEPAQPTEGGSPEAAGESVQALHTEQLSNGAVLSFWRTGAGGPAAVELRGPKDAGLEEQFALLTGANPIEIYEALREGPSDPAVLELLAPMASEWTTATIETQQGGDTPALLAPEAPDLVPKNHGEAWFTTNHCDQRNGTAVLECLHAAGPTVQGQNQSNGPFGQGTLLDPWLFTAYNDHTGNATFTMNWSGGVFLTAQVGANIVAVRSVNTNGNVVWGRMTNVGQVGHMSARAKLVFIH